MDPGLQTARRVRAQGPGKKALRFEFDVRCLWQVDPAPLTLLDTEVTNTSSILWVPIHPCGRQSPAKTGRTLGDRTRQDGRPRAWAQHDLPGGAGEAAKETQPSIQVAIDRCGGQLRAEADALIELLSDHAYPVELVGGSKPCALREDAWILVPGCRRQPGAWEHFEAEVARLDLSAWERRVAECVARGIEGRAAAQQLDVTEATFRGALTSLYRKFGVRSAPELMIRLLGGQRSFPKRRP